MTPLTGPIRGGGLSHEGRGSTEIEGVVEDTTWLYSKHTPLSIRLSVSENYPRPQFNTNTVDYNLNCLSSTKQFGESK